MTGPTRMIGVLAVFAIGSVFVLGLMAQRYAALVEGPDSSLPKPSPDAGKVTDWTQATPASETAPAVNVPSRSAEEYVEAFIEVRRALHDALEPARETESLTPSQLTQWIESRDTALQRVNLDPADYIKLRRVYRLWKDGRKDVTDPLLAAFEAKRTQLEQLNLGPFEPLDG